MPQKYLWVLLGEVDRQQAVSDVEGREHAEARIRLMRFVRQLDPGACHRLIRAVYGEVNVSRSKWTDAFTTETNAVLIECLATLPDADFAYLEMRYGLFDGIQRWPPELAERFAESREAVEEQLNRAHRLLRHPSRMRMLDALLEPLSPPESQPDEPVELLQVTA